MLRKGSLISRVLKLFTMFSFVFALSGAIAINQARAAEKTSSNSSVKSTAKKTTKTSSSTASSSSSSASSSKRQVKRTREDMILEAEMIALKEAIATKSDQENTEKFASKAEKELEVSQQSAQEARDMLAKANATVSEMADSKTQALSAIDRAQAAADEARAMADKAKTEAKLAALETSTYTQLRTDAKDEVSRAESREESALTVLETAKSTESYYRELVKRRIRNAEDFYYIAAAAMKKGGNAQALEFAVKAKAEMEQAKIAENEAAIRAEATLAAEKIVDARREATVAAKVKSAALLKLLQISQGMTTSLTEAYEAAQLSSDAAAKVLARIKDFASSKDELLAFTNKKVESLTDIKDAAEKKELLANAAAESARAVVAAKAKAQSEAQARANAALMSAKSFVIGDAPETVPAAGSTQQPMVSPVAQ